MKRRYILVCVLLVFLTSFLSYAGASDKIKIKINGKSHTVSTVPVMVDNKELPSLVPSVLLSNRTLVPLRALSEYYNLKVGWNNDTQEVTLSDSNSKIVLQINSKKVTVNGAAQTLDENAKPRLVIFPDKDARTMVPLRFISEVLKYDVSWDEKNLSASVNRISKSGESETQENKTPPQALNEILSIYYSEEAVGNELLVLKAAKEIKFTETFEKDSGILKITLSDTRDGVYPKDYLSEIQASQTSNIGSVELRHMKENSSDLVFTMKIKNGTPYQIKPQGSVLTVHVGSETAVKPEVHEGGTVVVTGVSEFEGGGFLIKGAGKAKYNLLKLDNPTRIVADIKDAYFNSLNQKTYPYVQGDISQVRISQFTPEGESEAEKIVRVVLDVKEGANPDFEVIQKGADLLLAPKNSLLSIIRTEFKGNSLTLTLNFPKEISYTTEYNSEQKLFTIHLPKDALDIPNGSVEMTGLIKNAALEDGIDEKVMTLKFEKEVQLKVLSPPVSSRLVLEAERLFTGNASDFLVWIDPGHGGKDPGCRGYKTGTLEKNVTLPVGLKVREILQGMGYRVMMTREGDTHIELFQRPELANSAGADVFVSIHANSIDGNKHNINGIEAFYYKPNEEAIGRANQKHLMQYIYEEAAKRTGLKKRLSSATRPYVVIKYTKMPAMLIELGYMTNVEDEKRLVTPQIQEKFAEAIAYGIDRYLKEFGRK